MASFGTSNDLCAWGVSIVSSDNEIANNLFSNNSAVCINGNGASNSLEIFAGSNNNIHDNNSFNDRVFTELGSSAAVTSTNNTFNGNLFVTSWANSRFITTRGAGDTSYGPVVGTNVVHNTTFQTGAGSQAVVCSLGCNSSVLSMSANVLWAEEKALYADAPFDLGRNLMWNSAGAPFAQLKGGSIAGFVVADPAFLNPASGDYRSGAAPDLGIQRAPGAAPVPVGAVNSKQRILDTRPGP